MKIHFKWISKYRVDDFCKCFFINCGVLFIMLNIVSRYWPTEREPFGGFIGQLLFAMVIAVSSTYFSGRKTSNKRNKNETEQIT